MEQVFAGLAGVDFDGVPGQVREHTKLVLLDTLGAIMAGPIKTMEDPGFTAALPGLRPAGVTVFLRGGGKLNHSVKLARGERENPWDREAVYRKFFRLASRTLDEKICSEVVSCIGELENMDNIRRLTALLCRKKR